MKTHTFVFKQQIASTLTIGHSGTEAWEKCKGKSKDTARSQDMEKSLWRNEVSDLLRFDIWIWLW